MTNARLRFVFATAVVVASLRYWVSAPIHFPADPFSVLALCKAGDIEYYPMAAAFARGELGESVLYERTGQRITSFPFVSIAPHALALAAFGRVGLIAVDVLVYIAYYLSLVAFLKAARIASPWRECVGLVVVAGGNEIQYLFSRVAPAAIGRLLYQLDLTFWVWGERIPRPFVSEIFLVLALAALVRLIRSRRALTRTANWALLGAALAALLQGDFHGTVDLALLVIPVGLYAHYRTKRRCRSLLRSEAVFLGVFILGCAFFILQRLGEHPDLPRRFGIFAVPRLGSQLVVGNPLLWLAPVACGLAVTAVALRCWGRRLDWAIEQRIAAVLSLGVVLACFALPISALVLGKTIQPYHFTDRFMHLRTYTLLVLGLWTIAALAQGVGKQLSEFARRRLFRGAAVALPAAALVVVGCWFIAGLRGHIVPIDRWVLGSKFRAVRRDPSQHMRAATFDDWASLPDYRRHFAALVRELEQPAYADSRVIGTFDLQVYSWWATFHSGYSFLPEAFLTTASDQEIEDRLMRFCRLLGLDDAAFLKLIDRRYVTVFWLGCDKYQASVAHSFSTLDDYSPAARAKIGTTSFASSWNMAIPISEQNRLVHSYQITSVDRIALPRLDVIVLIKALEPFTPPADLFEPRYENAVFKVWSRKVTQVAYQSKRHPPGSIAN